MITAVGEMFASRPSPDQGGDASESLAVNSYPRLLAAMLSHTASMVGVRPPKLPNKVVRYCNVPRFCVGLNVY